MYIQRIMRYTWIILFDMYDQYSILKLSVFTLRPGYFLRGCLKLAFQFDRKICLT